MRAAAPRADHVAARRPLRRSHAVGVAFLLAACGVDDQVRRGAVAVTQVGDAVTRKAEEFTLTSAGIVRYKPTRPLEGYYVREVTFVAGSGRRAAARTFWDVKLARRALNAPWLIDAGYYERSVLPALGARAAEVAFPAAGVVQGVGLPLRGTYVRPVSFVGRGGRVVELDRVPVGRRRVGAPWVLSRDFRTRLTKTLGGGVQIVYPF